MATEARKAYMAIYNRAYRAIHRERLAELDKTRRDSPGRRELLRRCDAAWRKRNPDHRALITASWARAHPEKRRESEARRRAAKLHSPAAVVSYARIVERDGLVCHLCHANVHPEDLSFDHVIPLFLGGPHIEENIRVAHLKCNIRKGARALA